jgi:predicted regulator of Ras-like GTPase activity (Roadblock/LC7/MglB family)
MDESMMEGLQSIKGYLGGAINNYTGECLVCDAQKLSGNLEEVSATFNDIFRDSHAVSKNLKLGATKIMEIHTEKGKVLMGCSGEDSRVHLHIFAIFTEDGNVALGKMALNKILPEAVKALS